MTTVRLASNGVGGTIQGSFGTYVVGSDGTVTVDSRDAPPLIAAGMGYLANRGDSYTTPIAPAAAASGQIVASGGLTNGSVSIANQPDIMRQVSFVIGAGTVAVTAGTVTVVYVGSDQQSHTDVLSAACAASGTTTQPLSRGVVSVTSVTIAGVTGGASPFIHGDTTALIAVPSDPGAQDFVLNNEIDDTGRQTAGTFSTSSLGCTTLHAAPNGTHTYSLAFSYVSPVI